MARKKANRTKKKRRNTAAQPSFWLRYRPYLLIVFLVGFGLLLFSLTEYESYASLYDAEYVGAETCGECHKVAYADWEVSPHAKMARLASAESVVGDFHNGEFFAPGDDIPTAKMFERDNQFFMAIRASNDSTEYIEYPIKYTIGFQYRQTYLTEEAGGVLRRLPVQWSVERQEFYPYWNYQEESIPSADDLHAQMQVPNSAWNLFCGRCHTTHLEINDKDAAHTRADTQWVDDGVACESCHGPGSQHVNYFEHNYVNRVAAFLNSNLRGEPSAYIANAPKLPAGQDMSVCARCHGADIMMSQQDIYRTYEPGYSREGKTNDISHLFQAAPVTPGRETFTVEVHDNGNHKGIGMLFRSFVDSACYSISQEPRCYDCHDPHNNKGVTEAGILHPSDASNGYCLECHQDLSNQIEAHSNHEAGTEGSFCMDCHMPKEIVNKVSMTDRHTRTHNMSSIPDITGTLLFGYENAPNACNECHADQSAEWAQEWYEAWWGQQLAD